MTAIKGLEKLEAVAKLSPADDDYSYEIFLTLGETSLILSNKDNKPFAHWSLAAIKRYGRRLPAIYGMDNNFQDIIEIDDRDMISALDAIIHQLHPKKTPSLLKRLLPISMLLIIAVLFLNFWLPYRLSEYAAHATPESLEAEIGFSILKEIERLNTPLCYRTQAQQALTRFTVRIFPEQKVQIFIADIGSKNTIGLPNGMIILHKKHIEGLGSAEAVAGYILAEALRISENNPLIMLFDRLNIHEKLTYLATTKLDKSHITDFANDVMKAPSLLIEDERLLAAFYAVKLPSTPYAQAIDPTGLSVSKLIAFDPIKGPYPEILDDQSWLTLQSICLTDY